MFKADYTNVINKFKQLYLNDACIPWQAQFADGKYHSFKKWFDKHSREELLRLHLDSWMTLQVKSIMESAKWFTIDVDSQNGFFVKKCVKRLLEWVPQEYINISHSGNKGYHIELYFEEPVRLKDLELLALWISQKVNMRLEFIPTPKKRAIKLPLGYNHKTGNYCCYVDSSLMPVEDSYSYFLNINRIPKQYLIQIPKPSSTKLNGEVLQLPKLGLDYLPNVEALMEDGIFEQGTRHDGTLKICCELRNRGYSKEDAKAYLWNWSECQFEAGKTKSSLKEIGQDIKGIVKYVYNPKFVVHRSYHNGNHCLNRNEYDFIKSVSSKTDNDKKVLLALVIHAKRWIQNDGSFFMSIKQIQEATSLKEMTVIRALERLKNQNKVTCLQKGNSIKKRSNKYSLPISIEDIGEGLLIKQGQHLTLEPVQQFFEPTFLTG